MMGDRFLTVGVAVYRKAKGKARMACVEARIASRIGDFSRNLYLI